MNYLALIIYTVIIVPYFIVYSKKNRITPVSTFLFFQMIMFYGMCFSTQGRTYSAHKLQYLYCIAMTCFVLGVETSKKAKFIIGVRGSEQINLYDKNRGFEDKETTPIQKMIIWTIIILSIVLCTLLFARNGGNIFVLAFINFINKNYSSLSDLRKNYVDVSGIGYIYQFRVILLPILSSYVLFVEKTKTSRLITVPVYGLMVAFLLGTGQRNAFVFYCFLMMIYIVMMRKEYNMTIISKSKMMAIAFLALTFLVILTIGNGRVDGANKVGGALASLIRRVFLVDQESAIVGFEYMDSQETVWGYDWWKMLEQMLPGKSDYVPVANISYYIVYGTYRGTNPPCLWGSAWYNFWIFGVTVFPFVVGMMYERLHRTTLEFKGKDRLYLLIYAGLCTYLGVWTSGTLMTLFNNGVITLLILRWLCYKAFRISYN